MSLFDNTSSPPVVISFNSKDRISGTNSNFQSKPVDLGVNKYNAICLIQASIPRSFYNVPSGYNTFTLRELGVNTTITIPVGSYNRINIKTAIATALNTSSPNGWVYSVSYPTSSQADTFKFTFSVSGNTGQPSFIFTTNMARQMGFDDNSTNIFVANTLTSTNCINLSYITRAFIRSDIVLNANDGILEEILNYGSYPMLSLAYYQQYSFDLNSRDYNPSASNSWTFSLTDSYGELIELNGIPWSFSVVFYQRADTHQLHKEDLLIRNEERLFNVSQQQEILKQQLEENIGVIKEELKQDISTLKPIFPVLPFGSSSIIPNLLPVPEIKYPEK